VGKIRACTEHTSGDVTSGSSTTSNVALSYAHIIVLNCNLLYIYETCLIPNTQAFMFLQKTGVYIRQVKKDVLLVLYIILVRKKTWEKSGHAQNILPVTSPPVAPPPQMWL
jgi:hypothetical protein